MHHIALIVHTCDRYKLLYSGFEHFFKKYWPYTQIAIGYYFLTEETDYQSDVFTTIKTGKGEWSDRLAGGLKQISERYIIYLQEDMWLNQPVDADTVNKIIKFVVDNDVKLFKLSSNAVYQTTSTGNYINGLSVSVLNNKTSGYLMSHQASIWDKDFLAAQLKFKEHPWRNEREGTKRLRALDPKIYHIDLFSENGEPPINNNGNYLKTSGYSTVSQNAALNNTALPFIDELKASGNKALHEYGLQLAYNYERQLTHDGQSKPRKEDVFKKIKKYFKK